MTHTRITAAALLALAGLTLTGCATDGARGQEYEYERDVEHTAHIAPAPSSPVGTEENAWARPETWSAPGDPGRAEVPLESASPDWRATLVVDNDSVGIWTVRAYPVYDIYATPEIVGLDDLGRCHVLTGYSGKWKDQTTIHDQLWLGGLTYDDLDPRTEGGEIYTGGKRGNLFQVRAYGTGDLDNRLIAQLPGKEIHTLIAGDVDPRTAGRELLVFTRPGGLYRATPDGPDGTFRITHLEDLAGRVRDAVLVPGRDGRPGAVAGVSRAGWLKLLTIDSTGPKWQTIYSDDMGMGRIAIARESTPDHVVLYATHDDGRILRFERRGGESAGWTHETIYLGPQGPRGIVAGRFDPDPEVETVAIFGYSGLVELLSRRGNGPWTAETLFEDRHKGHWLAIGELDGRNTTDELVASGYGARIVMLARKPGTGRTEITTDFERRPPHK